jgi:PEP-CTERM motif
MLASLGMVGSGHAAPLYFQGFETDTSGWTLQPGGDGNGGITQVPSGGGSLGLTAYQGGYYAEVQNNTNSYQAGYGSGGFSFLNGNGVTAPPYPGSSFSQSISVYINVNTPAPSAAGVPAFWIDMSPSLIADDGVGCDPAACADEHNFNLTYTGSSVQVGTDGSAPVLTINSSGWYTFQDTYAKGATPSSLVQTNENIFNASGILLSSTAALGNSDGGTLTSNNLAGPGYIWLPVWQDGFSGDLLGIDNVRADAVPEPSTIDMLAAGLVCLMGFGVARIQRR